MEIARERFLDDSRSYHMTLTLRSRTTEMHSLLTALTSEERDAVNIALARALDDIRAVPGNDAAIKAYRDGVHSFPDGTIIARLAWSYDSSEENNKAFGRRQSYVAGHPKNGVQFMVKDSKKYASTGGWSYAHFDEGKPLLDASTLQRCFDCHLAIKDHDFVFTRYTP